MKHRVTASILACCLLLAAAVTPFTGGTLKVCAAEGTYDVLTYNVNFDTIIITGCDTSASSVEIPAEIDGMPVTAIGDSAFYGCTKLNEIIIPDTVVTIGDAAFYNCTSLDSLNIPYSVEELPGSAFQYCYSLERISTDGGRYYDNDGVLYDSDTNTLVCYPAAKTDSEFTVPDWIPVIGQYAFSDCLYLETLILSDDVEAIEACAFTNSESLQYVYIPDSVTSIQPMVFAGCRTLNYVVLPQGLTTIPYGMFINSSISSIDIPESVTIIEDFAFSHCRNLFEVTIPDAVYSIGSDAFSSCEMLDSIIIPEGVETVGENAFSDCLYLSQITFLNPDCEIYDSSGTISTGKIRGMENSTAQAYAEKYGYSFEVVDESEVITPDEYLTYEIADDHVVITGCNEEVTLVRIPAEIEGLPVTEIAEDAFEYCCFSRVSIPETITDISALLSQYDLIKISVPDTHPAFSLKNDILYNKDMTEIVRVLPALKKTSFTIPDSVVSIGRNAFSGCSSLTSIEIPDSVTTIQAGAFSGCSGLTGIEIPDSVTAIQKNAFSGCSGLTSIEIPDSVTTIQANAFYDCSSLTSVRLPDTITEIDSGTFYNCKRLRTITIPESVTTIDSTSFFFCESLTEVFIPENVSIIQGGSFGRCTALEKVTISGGSEFLVPDAFFDCFSLSSITILNPSCEIFDAPISTHTSTGEDAVFSGTIYGYTGSTAQAYAEVQGYHFESLGEAPAVTEPEPAMTGDANEDGAIDVLDIIVLNKNLLGAGSLTDQGKRNADVDGDGTPSGNDSLMIMKFIVKLIDTL